MFQGLRILDFWALDYIHTTIVCICFEMKNDFRIHLGYISGYIHRRFSPLVQAMCVHLDLDIHTESTRLKICISRSDISIDCIWKSIELQLEAEPNVVKSVRTAAGSATVRLEGQL